jgi:hypothetical protein
MSLKRTAICTGGSILQHPTKLSVTGLHCSRQCFDHGDGRRETKGQQMRVSKKVIPFSKQIRKKRERNVTRRGQIDVLVDPANVMSINARVPAGTGYRILELIHRRTDVKINSVTILGTDKAYIDYVCQAMGTA